MQIDNKQLKDFLLDAGLLDKETVEENFKEANERALEASGGISCREF